MNEHTTTKKLAAAVILLCMGASAFCGLMLEGDGYYHLMDCGLEYSCFDSESPLDTGYSYVEAAGLSASLLWEFDTSVKKPVHWYAGFDSGLLIYGLTYMVKGGFSWKLAKLGPVVMELDTSLAAGYMLEIFSDADAVASLSCGLTFMSSSRKGLYCTIGVSDVIIPDVNYYVDYGLTAKFENFLSAKASVGIRF